MAFGMSLLFILNACGRVGNKGNTLETVASQSAEKNTGDQSGRSSSRIAQAGQEVAKTAEYETKEIHVDKEGMDIYGVVHILSEQKKRCRWSLCPMSWARPWTG